MASTQINYTQTTPTNAIKYTLSMWAKRSNTFAGDSNYLASVWVDGNNHWCMRFNDDQLNIYDYISSSVTTELKTTRKFRDPSAWYHIVYVYDSANVTAGDRQKIYVNGVEETSFATDTNPSSSAASVLNVSGRVLTLGARNSASYFEGEMSHVQFVDGLALAPTDFGETDATDGMWKLKTASYGTAGANGFHLKMEDSSNLDLDSSSNGHTFSTTGTLTATNDNPDNNMSTLSPLIPVPSGLTISNGNTSIASTATQWAGRYSTQRVFSGKYYVEAQFVSTGDNFKFGVQGFDVAETANWSTLNTSYAGKSAVGYEYQCNNGSGYKVNNNSSPTWTNANFTPATSTIMMAFDLDNGKIWWGRNGTWFNTSGTANPATGTDAAFTGITTDNSPYLFGLSLEGNGSSSHINFGNGYFGTTAIGSPVTSNEGTWAYAPPTGFGAVNTKWINTF